MGKMKIKYGKNERLRMKKAEHEAYMDALNKYGRRVASAIICAVLMLMLNNIVEGTLCGIEAKLMQLISADDTLRVVGTATEYQLKMCNWIVVAITRLIALKTIVSFVNVILIKRGLGVLAEATIFINDNKGKERETLTKLETYYSRFIRMLMSNGSTFILLLCTVLNMIANLISHVATDALAVSNIIGMQLKDNSIDVLGKTADTVRNITEPVQTLYIMLMLMISIISIFKELMGVKDIFGTRI